MERYDRGEQVGEGTYGVVYRAKDKKSGEEVAIKKIRRGPDVEGVHWTALREIKLLKEIRHPNIVQLMNVYPYSDTVCLVFELCLADLEAVVRAKDLTLKLGDIKSYLQMILRGVEACHSSFVLHRDIKPNNLLVGVDYQLKLGDFGLARVFGSPDHRLSHQVVTRWYRSPELLYGASEYSVGVDMWSIGCVFGELMVRAPMFPGESDLDQLGKIFQTLGTPSEDSWPGMTSLPSYLPFQETPGQSLDEEFGYAGKEGVDLLAALLRFDPAARPTASEALRHAFFSSGEALTEPADLPRPWEVASRVPTASPISSYAANGRVNDGRRLQF